MNDDWKKQVWDKESNKAGEEVVMSKVDWIEAPEGAEFYSHGHFRKQQDGHEFIWVGNGIGWRSLTYSLSYTCHSDFEMRPEDTEPDWIEWDGKSKKCPVPDGHEYEIKFSDGSVERVSEQWCNWSRSEKYKYVTAYRDWTAFYESRYTPVSVSELSIEERIKNLEESHATLIKRFEEILSYLPTNKP